MDTLLQASKRTITKILDRMHLGCFNCGWNVCRCDIHHILPQSKGGTDDHSNLTLLCPNCHRMAHAGLLQQFKSFHDVVGDSWKQFYDVTPRVKSARVWAGKRKSNLEVLQGARDRRAEKCNAIAAQRIANFIHAQVDVSQYGWKQKAAPLLDVAPQRVVWYLKKYAPHLLDGAKIMRV